MENRRDLVSRNEQPLKSQEELLTENFYRWEKRGRGWRIWNCPVEIEPAYEPFFYHYVPYQPATIDDARKPTFLSSLVERFIGPPEDPNYATPLVEDEIMEPEPEMFYDSSPLVEFQISLPPNLRITKEIADQFLLSLTHASLPLSFELIGTADSITVQIACRVSDTRLVRQQLRAFFPEAVINETQDFLWHKSDKAGSFFVVDFGLSQEFMRPVRIFKQFEVDPLIAFTGALADLSENEVGVLQILFQAVRRPWAESILRSVTDWEGHSFFVDAPEMLTLASEKVDCPLYAAVTRLAAASPGHDRAKEIVKALSGALAQFSRPDSNEFIPLANDDYDDSLHETDLFFRETHRSGMILNLREIVSLVHPPSISVRSEKLNRQLRKTKAAPATALGHHLVLGENVHHGKQLTVTLSAEQRLRHMHVIGATGTGKSTLLLNLIIQDIERGNGVGVIDPHGDLIDQLLGHIPEKRFEDVVLFDPADTDYPIGFNILSAHSELEKNILASDLGAVFRRLSTTWGDQMTSVLGNAILAFLESDQGGTLSDLRHFLIDHDYRSSFLKTVKDREVVYFWQKEFPLLSGKPQAPVLTRLDTFLRPKIIRNMVSQKENRINFDHVLNRGKILLVKLAQGLVGEENAYLFGAFIVSKLHQVVMGRQEFGEAERPNFWLYIDEFQNFITPSMAAILSGARKYHLGLILSHQDLEQLWKRDSEVASSVISNPATRICFRMGDFDAKKLRDGFSSFDSEDFQNLGVGEAICRIERAEYDFNLKTLPSPAVDANIARHRRGQLIVLSRDKYARRREQVEAELSKDWLQAERQEPPLQKPKEEPVTAQPHPAEERATHERKEPPPREERLREVKKEPRGQARPHSSKPTQVGRGGQQHKYLQHLLKRMGESKGYRATIEKEILGGLGSIDVTLEKDAQSIACEIGVTTTAQHEIENLQKCLAAGFSHVVFITFEKKTLSATKELALSSLSENDLARVQFFTPEEFLSFLEEQEAQAANTAGTVRGYKVKVRYKAVDEAEKKVRKQAIGQTIVQAMRRLKKSS